ncbi:hypothetical protein IV203_032149 [Nitzschia inconspicua]|uniref:Uncharacterized protein n=1 Tax=Nitzschia inconspicua TaxID=303405 RepID=A0A9K3LZD8_9STRA|nr:hypothetical protein IV203_032149 [Nitzschia inconspicua]
MVVKQYKQYRRHPVNNEKGQHSDPHGPSHQRQRKSPNNNTREDRPNNHNHNNHSNKNILQQDPKNHLSRKTRNERTAPPSPPTRQQQQHHPSTRKTRNTTSVVAESIDSYRAEMAAKRLEQELRQQGYDPNTGGKLLRNESSVSSSHSDDCDKYWQTPEQESRSLEEYYDHDDDHFDDYDEDDYTSTVYTDDRDDVDSRAYRSAYYTTDPRRNTRLPANDYQSKRHTSGRRHTSYHEQWNNNIDDDDLSSRRTLDWNTKSTPKRNSIIPKQQQRRRRSSYSSSSSSASSYSFLEEESFISKLQDPRSRNPDHPQQGFHSYVPRTSSRRVYCPSKPRALLDGRDDIEQIDEDVSIFQLHKRTLREEQQDPPPLTEQQLRGATLAAKPMTKSSASASTRPIDNKGVAAYSIDTTTECESDGNNNHTLRNNKNQNQHPQKIPTSPYHANDMAGRISPPKTKYVTDHRTQSQLYRPSQQLRKGNEKAVQEMSSQSFDVAVQKKNATDANTDKSVSDGAPPSNVVIVSDSIPNGINGPTKTTTIPSVATKPKPHTSPSCLMGKELLFVQERQDEDNIKSKSNILTTVPPVKKLFAVATLTTTPPRVPQCVTPPRKQPTFLLNRVLHDNTLDTHVLTSSGDIELQLSHSCSLPKTPYFDERNDHIIIHSTKKPKIPKVVAGLSSALPRKPSKFLRKIIPAKKDVVGSTVGVDVANQVDNNGDPNHCSLVTKSELVQQGWSPGDIPECVEPGTADLSLFGRLIALQKEDNVQRRRAKEQTKALQNRVPKVEEEEVEEKEEKIQSTETEDWEVLSRESECISEESEKKQFVILEQQEMATSHRTSSSFKDDQLREEPISNTKPMVHQISKMEDDVQKKFGGLFGRVLHPRKVSEKKQSNESYISSLQASRGSQSVPSVSGWSNSIASSTTHSENQKALMLLDNQREKGTENTNKDLKQQMAVSGGLASKSVWETRDTCSLSKEQKCDPPEGENGTLEETVALPNAMQSIDWPIVEKAQADMPIQPNSNQSVEMPKTFQMAESTETSMKSSVVEKVACATTDPVFVLSNDSDDGIPVPSVSVQELNAMLESRSTETEQEVTIEGNDSNDVSLQAVRSKKRVFGLVPRVFQRRQDCNSLVDLSSGRDCDMQQITKENQIEKACERSSPQLELAQAQNIKTNHTKSLADSSSIQSSKKKAVIAKVINPSV